MRPVSQTSQASHQMQSNQTLMLDSLQASNMQIPSGISMIQTPQSMLLNISKQNEIKNQTPDYQKQALIDNQITQKPLTLQNKAFSDMRNQEQQYLLQQLHYQSPYFNQAEDSAHLIQFFSNLSNQLPDERLGDLVTQAKQSHDFLNQDPSQLTLKNIQLASQSSQKSNSSNQEQVIQQQSKKSEEKSKERKSKSKKSKAKKKNAEITKKLAKKNYNEQEYSNRKHYNNEQEQETQEEEHNQNVSQLNKSQNQIQIQSQNSSYQDYEPSLNYISQLNQSGLAQLEQLSLNLNSNLDLAQMQQLLFIHNQNVRNQNQQESNAFASQTASGSSSTIYTQQYDSAKINTTASAESQKQEVQNQLQEYLTNENAREFIMRSEMPACQINMDQSQERQMLQNPYIQIVSQKNVEVKKDDSSLLTSDDEQLQNQKYQDYHYQQLLWQQQMSTQDHQNYYQDLMNQINLMNGNHQISGQGVLMTNGGEQEEEYKIEKYQSASKNDQSLINVLSEMNISQSQSNSNNSQPIQNHFGKGGDQSRSQSGVRGYNAAEPSFLDKSGIQFLDQSEHLKENKSNKGAGVKPNKQNSFDLKSEQDNYTLISNQQAQSLGGSYLNSKNSTIVGQNLNPHFQSQSNLPSGKDNLEFEEIKERQNHPSITATSRDQKKQAPAPIHTQGKNMILQHNASAHHFSQPSNLLSPYGPNGLQSSSHLNNYDHFKSQCSEVVIRGSSETDISNRIQAMKQFGRARESSAGGREMANQSEVSSSQHFHSQNNLNSQNQHSHQISGCQSIVNLGEPPMHTRSQFTSIDTHTTYSPTKVINKRSQQLDQQQHFNSNLVPNIPKSHHQNRNFVQNPKLDQLSQLKLQQIKLDQLPIRDDIHIDSSYDPNDRFFEDKIPEQHLMAGDTFMKDTQKKVLEFNSTGQSKQVNHFIQNYHRAGYEKGIFGKDIKENPQQVLYTTQENYQSLETEGNHLEMNDLQTNGSGQQQTENDFNYTVRLDELTQQQKSQSNSYAQRPPIYQPSTHHHSLPAQNQMAQQYQSYTNHYMNGTGSTAGFPQIYGYQPSQQSGRKSSVNSSFQSQNIKHSDSQSTLPIQSMQSQRSIIVKANIKKLSFMEKVSLIQRKVKEYLAIKKQRGYKQDSMQICNTKDFHRMMEGSGIGDDDIQKLVANHELNFEHHALGFFGDSTIQKPQDDSLSNISAQLLNSLKHDLGGSNLKQIKPSDQSYQKNILESLNLTTGNTFVKDTRHFKQGLLRERTQNFGNSSALVLYSGSTQDNRMNPFQRNSVARQSEGNILESQGSFQKPPLYEHPEYLLLNKEQTAEELQMGENLQQQMSPNTSGLLNMTDESNSGIFKLTPHASQNVTQKTGHTHGLYNQTNSHMNATESNNLNYSCSEIDSEWYNQIHNSGKQNIAGGTGNVGAGVGTVSPMSVNTTSSKIKTANGSKVGQRIPNSKMLLQDNNLNGIYGSGSQTPSENQNLIFNQRSSSIQSEQIFQAHSLIQRQSSKIKIEENFVQSPISSVISNHYQKAQVQISSLPPIHQIEDKQILQKDRQMKLLSILKSSGEYEESQSLIPEMNLKKSDFSNQQTIKVSNNQIPDLKGSKQTSKWKLLQPMRMQDFDDMIRSIFLQQHNDSNFKSISSQMSQKESNNSESKIGHSYKKQLVAMEL